MATIRRRNKKSVVWKNNAIPESKLTHIRYTVEQPIPEDLVQTYKDSLKVGHLFLVQTDLIEVDNNQAGVIPAPHPVLSKYRNMTSSLIKQVIEVDSYAVYMNTVRVYENARMKTISVNRHLFLINSGLYIIPNLNWIRPL